LRVYITLKHLMCVSRARYRRCSRELDQGSASRQPGVLSYAVYEVGGTAKGEAPYDVVEDIEVESREAWDKVNGYPEMQPVVKEWLDLCDPDSVSLVYASPI